MTWNLSSLDGQVAINFDADGNGGVSGTMTVAGTQYNVTGSWVASYSISNRLYSVFRVSGDQPNADGSYVSAAGRMDGPGDSPWGLQISGATSNTTNSNVPTFNEYLLPVAVANAGLVQSVFSQSGCIIVVDANSDVLSCTACYIQGQSVSTAGIVSGNDPAIIQIPQAAPVGVPVSIVFGAPVEHFAVPPLAEGHHQIYRVLMDPNGQGPSNTVGLVLEYFNGANGVARSNTQLIHFNDGHGHLSPRNHTSIMIRPSSL